jgi:hypothetical protein
LLGFKKVHFLDNDLMRDPIIDMIENIVTFCEYSPCVIIWN